jgi:uncharacterized protein YciI
MILKFIKQLFSGKGGSSMYVILVNYVKPLSEVYPYLKAHFRFVDEGFAAGYFLAFGPQTPRRGGVILAQAASTEELKAFISKAPFLQAGVATFEVVEFTPLRVDPKLQQILERGQAFCPIQSATVGSK